MINKKHIILTTSLVTGLLVAGYYNTHKIVKRDFNQDSILDEYVHNRATSSVGFKLFKKDGNYISVDNIDTTKLDNLKGINPDSVSRDSLENILQYKKN